MRIPKKIFTIVLSALILISGSAAALQRPAYALFENAKGEAQCGVNLQDGTTGTDTACADTTDPNQLSNTVKTVLNILSLVAGVIAVIMIIIAGIRFVTSQGDSGSTAAARNTLIYAVVGLIVVVLAQFIVLFVIGKTSKPTSGTVTLKDSQGVTTTTTFNADGSKTVCSKGFCHVDTAQ